MVRLVERITGGKMDSGMKSWDVPVEISNAVVLSWLEA